jgi:PRC-barrel domain
MKRLLMTTALMTVLAAPLAAQDRMDAPEGYSEFGDVSRLTLDDLQGATVYDVNGETLGEISDIVFALGGEGDMAADDAAMSDDAMADDTMSDDAVTDQQGDAATQDEELPEANNVNEEGDDAALAGDQAGVDQGVEETDTLVDGQDIAPTEDSTDPAESDDLSLDVDADADGTAGDIAETAEEAAEEITDTANEAIQDINEEAEQAVEETGDADMVDEDGAMVEEDADGIDAEAEGERISTGGGQVSHVIIDIGGFLGIGGHTVAVPMEALQIFADDNENLQIFLPWSEEQLRDLPAYEEGNPDTLGRMAD